MLKRLWDFLRSFETLSWFLICEQKVYSRARYTTLRDNKWKKLQKFGKNTSNNVWKLSSSDLPLLETKQPVKWGLKWADSAERSFEENFIKCQNRRGAGKKEKKNMAIPILLSNNNIIWRALWQSLCVKCQNRHGIDSKREQCGCVTFSQCIFISTKITRLMFSVPLKM